VRAFFLLLVLANLGFFAWSAFLAPEETTSDPRPMRSQIDPARIRVLASPAGTPQAVPAAKPKPATDAASAIPAACMEWGSFTIADTPAAEKALEPLALGAKFSLRRAEELAGWWVYMPPQGSRQAAQKKTLELKGMGVDDWFIVNDEGKWRFAVSLGVFRTEEAAKNHLEALKAKGVRTAQAGERELQVPKNWLQVRGADAALLSRWREIAANYPATEIRPCAQ
jgi:hypothetical protein